MASGAMDAGSNPARCVVFIRFWSYSAPYLKYSWLVCSMDIDYRNRKFPQIEKRKSRAYTPALSPAKSQGAGGSLIE